MADISTPNTALTVAGELVKRAAVLIEASRAISTNIETSRTFIEQALNGLGVTHRWVGTRLDLMGPDGAYISGPDLRGPAGLNTWLPVFSTVPSGERRLLRVANWTGGGGEKPPVGLYLGAEGYVSDTNAAVDIRGAAGGTTEEFLEKHDAVIAASESVAEKSEAVEAIYESVTSAPVTISASAYTVQIGDLGKTLRFVAACVVTFPADLPAGFYCVLRRAGAGAVTWVAASGGEVHSAGSAIADQWVSVVASVDENAGGSSARWIVEGGVL